VTVAWADHGAGLRSAGMSPLVEALVWGGLALLVGLVVFAIVSVLFPRRQSSE